MNIALSVACLGAGYFSQFHVEAWNRLPSCHLKAIADSCLEQAANANVELSFDSLTAMLTSVRPDILDIITPPPTHLAAIKEAAAHGVKTVICQKPFCQSLSEAENAVALAEAAGIRLVVHENFRFQPWYRCMKNLLDTGKLGTPLQMQFRLRTGDGQGPGAYLDRQPYFQTMPRLLIHETGVHWVDTFRYLFGIPSAVYADTQRLNPVIKGDDAAYFILDFEKGPRALFDGNRLLDNGSLNNRLTFGDAMLEGTDGTLTLNPDGSIDFRAFGKTSLERVLQAQEWPGFAGDCVHALQSHVVEAILNNAPLENSARDYLAVIKLVDLLYLSAKSGKKLVVSSTETVEQPVNP